MLAETLVCLVVGIADGDTLTARYGPPGAYAQVRVRLAAIDAPEKRQPFGRAARQSLADLCFGVEAKISAQAADRYGRIVADVTCRGQDAGAAQVKSGMAWVYDKYAKNHRHLYPLQDAARKTRAGLWRDLDSKQPPIPPWEWRRQKRSKRKA